MHVFWYFGKRKLFLSVVGFRQAVVDELPKGVGHTNLILLDGADLALILEGRVSLIDALDLKIGMAAQEGVIFCPLAGHF